MRRARAAVMQRGAQRMLFPLTGAFKIGDPFSATRQYLIGDRCLQRRVASVSISHQVMHRLMC